MCWRYEKKNWGAFCEHTGKNYCLICFKYQLYYLIFLNTKDADPGGSGVSKDQKYHWESKKYPSPGQPSIQHWVKSKTIIVKHQKLGNKIISPQVQAWFLATYIWTRKFERWLTVEFWSWTYYRNGPRWIATWIATGGCTSFFPAEHLIIVIILTRLPFQILK